MNIGIDVDGVIYDTQNKTLELANIYDNQILRGNGIVHPEKHLAKDIFDWSFEEFRKFSEIHTLDILKTASILDGVKPTLDRLNFLNQNLIIISARGSGKDLDNDKKIEILENRFKQDELYFNKIFWRQINKLPICSQENIDIFIDDSPIVCKELSSKGIKTIYLQYGRAPELNHTNIITAHNWYDIWNIIFQEIIQTTHEYSYYTSGFTEN